MDMHTHACNTIYNRVTLTFELLTSGSTHTELLPWGMYVPSLVLIADVVFLLERRQTDTHTHTSLDDYARIEITAVHVGNR